MEHQQCPLLTMLYLSRGGHQQNVLSHNRKPKHNFFSKKIPRVKESHRMPNFPAFRPLSLTIYPQVDSQVSVPGGMKPSYPDQDVAR